MGLVDLSHIKQLFSSKHPAQTDRELYRELMLMVLARAADADSYTHPAEVEVVQRVLEEHLGDRVESSDIRIAARSKLYETAPIEKYISRVAPKLSRADRREIVNALVEVLWADDRVASSEANYFNMVVSAMELSFADVAGLMSD